MDLFSPSSLPPISDVEVVMLDKVRPKKSVHEYMQATSGAPSIVVDGRPAKRLATLWRQLPKGNQMRCHMPPYGLRFFAGDRVLCQGSVCWECNNIYGDVEGEPFVYEFDAEAKASQALLSELRRVFRVKAPVDDKS
jgi:hypothetical protein